MEFQRVYEFLSRLRREFEPRRAQLFAQGRVPLLEVLLEIRTEETHLRGAGFLEIPLVLATRAPTLLYARSSVPSLLPILHWVVVRLPSGGEGRPCSHTYCG